MPFFGPLYSKSTHCVLPTVLLQGEYWVDPRDQAGDGTGGRWGHVSLGVGERGPTHVPIQPLGPSSKFPLESDPALNISPLLVN